MCPEQYAYSTICLLHWLKCTNPASHVIVCKYQCRLENNSGASTIWRESDQTYYHKTQTSLLLVPCGKWPLLSFECLKFGLLNGSKEWKISTVSCVPCLCALHCLQRWVNNYYSLVRRQNSHLSPSLSPWHSCGNYLRNMFQKTWAHRIFPSN